MDEMRRCPVIPFVAGCREIQHIFKWIFNVISIIYYICYVLHTFHVVVLSVAMAIDTILYDKLICLFKTNCSTFFSSECSDSEHTYAVDLFAACKCGLANCACSEQEPVCLCFSLMTPNSTYIADLAAITCPSVDMENWIRSVVSDCNYSCDVLK